MKRTVIYFISLFSFCCVAIENISLIRRRSPWWWEETGEWKGKTHDHPQVFTRPFQVQSERKSVWNFDKIINTNASIYSTKALYQDVDVIFGLIYPRLYIFHVYLTFKLYFTYIRVSIAETRNRYSSFGRGNAKSWQLVLSLWAECDLCRYFGTLCQWVVEQQC